MKILVIDDDKNLNRGICSFLNSNDFETQSAYDGQEGLDLVKRGFFNLVLSDLQMPLMNGIELIKNIQCNSIDIPIIIMTAFSSIENAVEAMKIGAEDYLPKPINLSELLIKIKKILNTKNLAIENTILKNKIFLCEMPDIIGTSDAVKELKELMRRIVNDPNIPVTIFGQSGTGKELVARNIHYMSGRKNKTFLPINCATLSDNLLESELFGYAKGAFTGAVQEKIGLIENCNGGTIFLDEISEMSPRVQSKLLRVIQDGMVQPVGSNEIKKSDVRFICASNQILSILVEQKKFREDLYFRLSVIELEVPSLAARKSDIPLLINHFFEKYDRKIFHFSEEALRILENYDWPGNIRELENLIRMLIITCDNLLIKVENLPSKFFKNRIENNIPNDLMEDEYKIAYNNVLINFDKSYLEYHLRKNNYNISKTADSINLSRVSLHKKIKEYSIRLLN